MGIVMTIVKRGNKFRLISGEGKNLGESDTKAGAEHREKQVQYFKHAKCIIDPELVKQQKYQPVIFQGKDAALGDKPDKDFPSTPLAYDLKDVAQPEFPSAPFSGQPYAQSFHNPTAGQGNDPDIQHKGSDFNNSHSSVIGDFASVQPSDGSMEKNSTGRGRTLIEPAADLKEGHVKPIKRSKSIRENSMTATGVGGQTSDFSRSMRLKGTNIVFKQHLNEFSYPNDRGPDSTPLDAGEETEKRKAFIRNEAIKEKTEAHRRHIAENKQFDSYLGRAKDSKPVGEYTKDYPGAKVTFDQPIDPTKKPKKVFTHLSPEGHKLHLQRTKKKEGGESLQLSVMYTQNQPLDASLKPIMEVKDDKKKTKKSFAEGTPIVGTSRGLGTPDKVTGISQKIKEKTKEIEDEQDEPVVSKETTDEENRQREDERQRKQTETAVKSFAPVQTYNPDIRPQKVKGGIGDKLKPNDVDSNQLMAGINVEQEHVGRDENKTEEEKKDVAQDIALDHLKEDKDYYTKLNEMERHGKEAKKEESKQKKILRMGKNEVGKSVVSLSDFRQSLANRGKTKKEAGFPRPYSVTQAEEKIAPVINIRKKEKQND